MVSNSDTKDEPIADTLPSNSNHNSAVTTLDVKRDVVGAPSNIRTDISTVLSPQMSPLQQHVQNKNEWGNVMLVHSPHSTLKTRTTPSSTPNRMTTISKSKTKTQETLQRNSYGMIEKISNAEESRLAHSGLVRWEHLYQNNSNKAPPLSPSMAPNPNSSVNVSGVGNDFDYMKDFDYDRVSKTCGDGFVLRILNVEQIPLR